MRLETCWAHVVCDLVEILHNKKNPDNRLDSRLSAQELIDNYQYDEAIMDKRIYNGVKDYEMVCGIKEIEEVVQEHRAVGCFHLTSNIKNSRSNIVDLEPVVRDHNGVSNEGGHAMVIVGHGLTKNYEPYWHVKNTRGNVWGDEGYVRLAKSNTEPTIP
nr:uncharacterized protein LOC125418493 [Ziziphus jujuba var. spinosa]